MAYTDKEILYTTTNTYSTLNTLNSETKYVWFVCHGMGYLSRYFINYFKALDTSNHYIIAPQAQSKYYIPPKFKHVGASWLTKENTVKETENTMRYFDAVLANENIPTNAKLIVLGYSQGVSVAMRYVASRQLVCDYLIIHSGGIPKELNNESFKFLNSKTKNVIIYGKNDPYLNEERLQEQFALAKNLFGNLVEIVSFDGEHEVRIDLVKSLID